jgi:3-oxoadipate enol-lactonase
MIDYKLSGDHNPETLFFVHGLGANLSQFADQHSFFSNEYRVISVNLRGHGGTGPEHPENAAEYTPAMMAGDISQLLDFLKISRVHFIGNSLGGNLGYELLKSEPGRLKTLTTFGTTAELRTPKTARRLMSLIYRLISPKLLGTLSAASGVTPEAKQKIKAMVSAVDKEAVLNILPHIANFSYLATLKGTDIPVMILKGEKDKEINTVLGTTVEVLEDRGGFILHEVLGAGHFINLDNPRLFNTLLLEFFRTHGESHGKN